MTRDFLMGPEPPRNGGMLRLGLQQLEASEILLRKLLTAYGRTKDAGLVGEIVRERLFLEQTLAALKERMSQQSSGVEFEVSGGMSEASRRLRVLIGEAERAVF